MALAQMDEIQGYIFSRPTLDTRTSTLSTHVRIITGGIDGKDAIRTLQDILAQDSENRARPKSGLKEKGRSCWVALGSLLPAQKRKVTAGAILVPASVDMEVQITQSVPSEPILIVRPGSLSPLTSNSSSWSRSSTTSTVSTDIPATTFQEEWEWAMMRRRLRMRALREGVGSDLPVGSLITNQLHISMPSLAQPLAAAKAYVGTRMPLLNGIVAVDPVPTDDEQGYTSPTEGFLDENCNPFRM